MKMFNCVRLAKGFAAVTAGAAFYKFSQNQQGTASKLRVEEMAVVVSMELEDLEWRTKQQHAVLDWKKIAPLSDEYSTKDEDEPAHYTLADFLASYQIDLHHLEMTPKEVSDFQQRMRMYLKENIRSNRQHRCRPEWASSMMVKVLRWMSRQVR